MKENPNLTVVQPVDLFLQTAHVECVEMLFKAYKIRQMWVEKTLHQVFFV